LRRAVEKGVHKDAYQHYDSPPPPSPSRHDALDSGVLGVQNGIINEDQAGGGARGGRHTLASEGDGMSDDDEPDD